jgi:hypothetical protein
MVKFWIELTKEWKVGDIVSWCALMFSGASFHPRYRPLTDEVLPPAYFTSLSALRHFNINNASRT